MFALVLALCPLASVAYASAAPAVASTPPSSGPTAGGTVDPIITFPDAQLEEAVWWALRVVCVFEDDIHQSDLANLRYLDASDWGITDLTGLEYCTHLSTLFLNNNYITDISPLRGLTNLRVLNLSNLKPDWTTLPNNQIMDISPLRGLTNLSILDLSGNQITDISPLRGLSNLWYPLNLSNNRIADISPLGGLTKLYELRLSNNQITNISPLRGLSKLHRLYLDQNQVTDISALVSTYGLSPVSYYVNLSLNPLDISAGSATMANIKTLIDRKVTIYYDPQGVDPIVIFKDPNLEAAVRYSLGGWGGDIHQSYLANVWGLYAEGYGITDLTGLEYCTNLSQLHLEQNQITDLSPLSGCTNLSEVYLYNNKITDISPLSGCYNLYLGYFDLFLTNNQITDISPLSGIIDLSWAELGNNQITDISALGLTQLSWLNLSGNQITDISALSGLTEMADLNLSDNQITDISPLVANARSSYSIISGLGFHIDLVNNYLDTTPGSQAMNDIQTLINIGTFNNGTVKEVTVTYLPQALKHTLTYAAGANGNISGTSPQTVNYGASGMAVTAVPATGYHFTSWSDGVLTASRTDTNVTANISVTANFAINTYTLTYTAGTNGSITGTSPQTVNYGASGTPVTAVANTGYQFVNWSDGSTANPRTNTNVIANISVTATFGQVVTGNKTVTLAGSGNVLVITGGNNTINGTQATSTTIYDTGGGNDQITLGGGTNKITITGKGNNQITTGSGNDSITITGDGNNIINAGDGKNSVTINGKGNNQITTGSGDDTIKITGDKNNIINAGDGNNSVTINGNGNNQITIGSGDDTVSVGNGNNTIKTGAGDDTITVGNGNNTIDGGLGSDTCSYGTGKDTITNCEKLVKL